MDDASTAHAIEVTASGAPARRPALRRVNNGLLHADGFHLSWHDEAAFDMVAGDMVAGDRVAGDLMDGARIAYTPGPRWTGTMPASFYGSAVALTLAWRGLLPFHASAVERDGCAVLIAGANGAGKSTLTAQSLAIGARLVGDDLTVLDMPAERGGIVVRRGRPTIRLHRDTAARVAADLCLPVAGDGRGKWLVRPTARSPLETLRLGGVVLLGPPDGPLAPLAAATMLAQHLFRPTWMKALPGHAARLRGVLALATRVPVHGMTVPQGFHADDRTAARLGDIIAGMCAAGRSSGAVLPP